LYGLLLTLLFIKLPLLTTELALLENNELLVLMLLLNNPEFVLALLALLLVIELI
jgi:hypothetical protein